jgi:hypothetical protein
MENNLLNNWLDLISNKKIYQIKLDDNIINKFNKLTLLKYIISFDIEFIRYVIKYKQVQTINEMGGMVFVKINNDWYLHAIFHLNLVPIIKNINQYYLLTSNYNTISKTTYKKVINNEKLLLPEYKINENNYKKILLKDPIINLYIKPIEIKLLLKKYYEKKKKKVEKIKFMIKGNDLVNLPNEYNIFIKNINLILNDKKVKKRQIIKTNEFIKLTNKLFSFSFLIVKGLEDIKALKNHTILLQQKYILLTNFFDIAIYNELLFNKCNSAKLEETYFCLEKMNLINDYDKYYKIINKFIEFKAHNPLADSYYTFIIFMILYKN